MLSTEYRGGSGAVVVDFQAEDTRVLLACESGAE